MKKIIALSLCALFVLVFPFYVGLYADADEPDISAKSAVVIDYTTGKVLYEKNAYEHLPMASTTKIMSALLCAESGGLDERFTVDSDAIKVEGSSMGLQEGDIVSKRILIYGMLLPSGNDAANATAVAVAGSVDKFVDLMNKKAAELGLDDTHFVTPSGLDDDTDEHYSTAYDMARLASAALENGIFREVCGVSKAKLCYGDPPYDRWLTNTNKLLTSLDGVIGVKTGFTDKAGRCLVSACERNGSTLICVTLNDRNDWADHTALYEKTFGLCEKYTLGGQENECEVNVVGGTADKAECFMPKVTVALPYGENENVNCVICVRPFVYAPVSQKEIVGSVRYYYNDKLIASTPLYTKLSVSAQGQGSESVAEYYFNKIKGFFASA